MIIIKLKGGLGNQLFQYSFGRLLSKSQNKELLLDKESLEVGRNKGDTYRPYSLDSFNIKARVASSQEIEKTKYPFGPLSRFWKFFKFKILRVFNIGYKPSILKSKANYFEGFFQSYKYLEPIRDELLKEISLKGEQGSEFNKLEGEIKNSLSVSIHVRRGDYIENSKNRKIYHFCDLNYYQKAISLLENKLSKKNIIPRFYVFSDDIAWAKKNISLKNSLFVSSSKLRDCQELILMSKCKHNIIANSSFSFWSAWLNTNSSKIIIAPSCWSSKYKRAYRYLLPDNYLRI